MHPIDLTIVIAYLLLMLLIGVLLTRRQADATSYFNAGGRVSWWMSGLSLYMSFFSAGLFVVWGSIAYQQGLVAIMIQWTMCLAGFAVAFWIAPRWKRTGILTVGQFIGDRYGTVLQQAYAYVFTAIGIITAGSVLYPVARMFNLLTGLPLTESVAVVGGVILLYTTMGGYWAVLITDTLQFVILLASVVITSILSVQEVGGLSAFLAKLPATHTSLTSDTYPPLFMLAFVLVHVVKIGGDWAYVQRFVSVGNERDARRTGLVFGGLYTFSPVLWMIPPIAYYLLQPGLDKAGAEGAYILICQRVLPTGLLGLMLAAMLSATSCKANTLLNICAAVLTRDVYQKLVRPDASARHLLRVARAATVLIGLLTMAVAVAVPHLGGVVEVVFSINAMTYVPVLAPPIWALFSRRLDARGIWLAVGGGLAVNLFFKFAAPVWLGLSLTRTQETVVGLVVTPLLLLAYERWQRTTPLPQWVRTPPDADKLQPDTPDQNQFGDRLVGWAMLGVGAVFLGLAALTNQHQGLVATVGLVISLVSAYILYKNYKPMHMTSTHTLTAEQVRSYQTNGYLVLRQVFSPDEVKTWQAEADRLLNSPLVAENNLRTAMHQLDTGTLAVERIDPVIDVSPLFNDLLRDERILGPLHDIFGETALLFKDKLIFKLPGMRGYEMHQDYAWWQPQPEQQTFSPIPSDKILSVMLSIDPATTENGALSVFGGYQHGLLSPVGELRNMTADETARIDPATEFVATTEPGDVLIFHSLTPHCSEPNRSGQSRRQLYMTYNAASCGDVYAGQQVHYRGYVTKRMAAEKGDGVVYFK